MKRLEGPRLSDVLDWVVEDMPLRAHIYDYIVTEAGAREDLPEWGGELSYDFETRTFVVEYEPREED